MLTAISPLQTHNDVPTLLSALRFVVNMFKFGSSLYVLQRLRE